jgi:hypothetical protein
MNKELEEVVQDAESKIDKWISFHKEMGESIDLFDIICKLGELVNDYEDCSDEEKERIAIAFGPLEHIVEQCYNECHNNDGTELSL